MNKKSFYAILSAGLISSVLSGCGSLDSLVPPQSIGNGAQLEGPVGADPSWQPYNSGAVAQRPMPVPSSPDPNWRSAASTVVRAEPLEPADRAVPVDPTPSETGSVRARIDTLKSNESSWGTYSGGGNGAETRAYSSRPDRQAPKSKIYSPWADRIVGSTEKAAFDRMVMEATRTGGSRLTLRDGRYLAADRLEQTTPGGCLTVVVNASSNETTPPFSTGEVTVCD
jgi:hypothetical protein